ADLRPPIGPRGADLRAAKPHRRARLRDRQSLALDRDLRDAARDRRQIVAARLARELDRPVERQPDQPADARERQIVLRAQPDQRGALVVAGDGATRQAHRCCQLAAYSFQRRSNEAWNLLATSSDSICILVSS